MRVASGQDLQVRARGLTRAVIDDDNLVRRLLRVCEHTLEDEASAREVVTNRDDYAGDRRRGVDHDGRNRTSEDVLRCLLVKLEGAARTHGERQIVWELSRSRRLS
jgi:hypothetical protein